MVIIPGGVGWGGKLLHNLIFYWIVLVASSGPEQLELTFVFGLLM